MMREAKVDSQECTSSSFGLYEGTAYKYRDFQHLDSEKKSRIARMFSDCEIFFANPVTFNDPFDCNPVIETKNSHKLRKPFLKILKRKGLPRTSRYLSNYLYEMKNGGFNSLYRDSLSELFGLCCMSKSGELINQWTHYANNHTGFCVEYALGGTEFPGRCVEVNYTSLRPTIDVHRFQVDDAYRLRALQNVFIHKSLEWEKEEEIRIFGDKKGACSLPAHFIKGVIFGKDIDPQHQLFLEQVIRSFNLKISTYKIALSAGSFGLHKLKLS